MPDRRKDQELKVAQRFLSLAGYTQAMPSPVAQDPPDFRVQLADSVVGLELAGYREQCPENNAFALDDGFKDHLFQAAQERPVLRRVTNIFYKSLPHRQISVPFPSDRASVTRELEDLASRFEAGTDIEIHFVKSHVAEASNEWRSGRDRYLASAQFPNASRHFKSVIVNGDATPVCLKAHTSASGRFTAADVDEIERVIKGKCAAGERYTRGLPEGTEFWLLLHSDGWPPTAHISNERIMERCLDKARSLLRENTPFAHAWWLDNACFSESTLYPIC